MDDAVQTVVWLSGINVIGDLFQNKVGDENLIWYSSMRLLGHMEQHYTQYKDYSFGTFHMVSILVN